MITFADWYILAVFLLFGSLHLWDIFPMWNPAESPSPLPNYLSPFYSTGSNISWITRNKMTPLTLYWNSFYMTGTLKGTPIFKRELYLSLTKSTWLRFDWNMVNAVCGWRHARDVELNFFDWGEQRGKMKLECKWRVGILYQCSQNKYFCFWRLLVCVLFFCH